MCQKFFWKFDHCFEVWFSKPFWRYTQFPRNAMHTSCQTQLYIYKSINCLLIWRICSRFYFANFHKYALPWKGIIERTHRPTCNYHSSLDAFGFTTILYQSGINGIKFNCRKCIYRICKWTGKQKQKKTNNTKMKNISLFIVSNL